MRLDNGLGGRKKLISQMHPSVHEPGWGEAAETGNVTFPADFQPSLGPGARICYHPQDSLLP